MPALLLLLCTFTAKCVLSHFALDYQSYSYYNPIYTINSDTDSYETVDHYLRHKVSPGEGALHL